MKRRHTYQSDKERNPRECSKYRVIMLLSVLGNVLNKILLERMNKTVDPKLCYQQAGFKATDRMLTR